jgi:transglutaminase-like putative cysteine protease
MTNKNISRKQWITKITLCAAIVVGLTTVIFVLFFNPQRTFTITETFRITSESGSATYLKVDLPISGGYQEISNFLVEGAEEYSVEYFNGWRELTVRVPSDGSEVIVVISFTAQLFRSVQPWEGEVLAEYTLPQQFIDSDNAAIIALASELRGGSDYETARNILNHVYRLISWPTDEQINVSQLYASELLEYPIGVCADFTILMTALLRAEGIPARPISGLTLSVYSLVGRNASDWGHLGSAHAWVEFFADGKWHFADPSWDWFDRNATEHLSFGMYEANINSDFQHNLITKMEDAGFFINGAMSAPLRFRLWSTDENATVIPRGDVRFSWFR